MATQSPAQYAAPAPPAGTISGLHVGVAPGLASGPVPGSVPGLTIGSANPHSPSINSGLGEAGSPRAGLVPQTTVPDDGSEIAALRLSPRFARLPVELEVVVPVRDFRVRSLLALVPGEVIETRWGHGEDLPLSSGDLQLAWSEFEIVDSRLAVRVTRLA